MYTSIFTIALGLTSSVLARPVVEVVSRSTDLSVRGSTELAKRTTVTGTAWGTEFAYGSAAAARETFYTAGACGLSTYFVGVVPDSMPLLAIPATLWSQYGSAQNNQLCAKIITLTYNGKTTQAAIADQCGAGCMDMTSDTWEALGQTDGNGSDIYGISYSIALTTTTSTGTCTATHTVVSGEYCYLIWTEYGITEAQLYAWNPTLDSACDLAIGQVLCVSE